MRSCSLNLTSVCSTMIAKSRRCGVDSVDVGCLRSSQVIYWQSRRQFTEETRSHILHISDVRSTLGYHLLAVRSARAMYCTGKILYTLYYLSYVSSSAEDPDSYTFAVGNLRVLTDWTPFAGQFFFTGAVLQCLIFTIGRTDLDHILVELGVS